MLDEVKQTGLFRMSEQHAHIAMVVQKWPNNAFGRKLAINIYTFGTDEIFPTITTFYTVSYGAPGA